MSMPVNRHPSTGRSSLGPPILVDSHVHIHAGFDLGRFLDSASENSRRALGGESQTDDASAVLMLTEIQGVDVFAALADGQDSVMRNLGGWQLSSTPDPKALLFEKTSSIPILLVAGRQIRVHTGLEVLALACLGEIADGLEIELVLRKVDDAGALAVIPWGFGKWTLARKRRIQQLIEQGGTELFCLGDVGGRWRGLAEPQLLVRGRRKGFAVLPGSDPLPFPEEVERAGSAGVVIPQSLTLDQATSNLVSLLRRQDPSNSAYLQLQSLPRFLRHQILMQIRRLLPAGVLTTDG